MGIKVDIIAGFLGTGKTTLINKVVPVIMKKENVVIIENEFGEIGIDGQLIPGNIPMREIYAGCICCTLVGNFITAIKELVQQFHPDRIVIEPSGVSQLTDVISACQKSDLELEFDHLVTIIDSARFKNMIQALGDFYIDQIKHANLILLSHMTQVQKENMMEILMEIRKLNPQAAIIEEDWFAMDNEYLVDLLDVSRQYLSGEIEKQGIQCGQDIHHHKPANHIFTAWGQKNPPHITLEQLSIALENLKMQDCGFIWRGKGILKLKEGNWIHFDYTPGCYSSRLIEQAKGESIVIIGCRLDKERLTQIFSFKGQNRDK